MKCILAGFWNVSLFEKQAYWEILWNLLFKAHLLRRESKAFHQVPQKKQAKHRKRAISRALHHQSHLLKKTLEHSFPVSLSKFKTFLQLSKKRGYILVSAYAIPIKLNIKLADHRWCLYFLKLSCLSLAWALLNFAKIYQNISSRSFLVIDLGCETTATTKFVSVSICAMCSKLTI